VLSGWVARSLNSVLAMSVGNFVSATQRSALRDYPSLSPDSAVLVDVMAGPGDYVLVYLCLLVSREHCYCVFRNIVRIYLLLFRLYAVRSFWP
jgi:hypothetical protein